MSMMLGGATSLQAAIGPAVVACPFSLPYLSMYLVVIYLKVEGIQHSFIYPLVIYLGYTTGRYAEGSAMGI